VSLADAVSLDLLPSDQPGPHLQMDIYDLQDWSWDLMIAHPPCTYLCNSGVRWLGDDEERWDNMREGADFFKFLLDRPVRHIAVENPIMHRYAVDIIGRRQNQVVQPWMFGHGETKATCLWLKNLPPLKATDVVEGREPRIHRLPPSPERWRLRSITYQGIADAMALQWGNYIRWDRIRRHL
jgi:hypothetical protein